MLLIDFQSRDLNETVKVQRTQCVCYLSYLYGKTLGLSFCDFEALRPGTASRQGYVRLRDHVDCPQRCQLYL